MALFATKVVIILNYNKQLFSAIQDRLMDMAFKIEFKNVADRLELNLKSTLLVILNRTKRNVLLIVLVFFSKGRNQLTRNFIFNKNEDLLRMVIASTGNCGDCSDF